MCIISTASIINWTIKKFQQFLKVLKENDKFINRCFSFKLLSSTLIIRIVWFTILKKFFLEQINLFFWKKFSFKKEQWKITNKNELNLLLLNRQVDFFQPSPDFVLILCLRRSWWKYRNLFFQIFDQSYISSKICNFRKLLFKVML